VNHAVCVVTRAVCAPILRLQSHPACHRKERGAVAGTLAASHQSIVSPGRLSTATALAALTRTPCLAHTTVTAILPVRQTLTSEANDTVRRLAAFGIGAALAYVEPEVQAPIVERLLGRSGSAGAGAGASSASGADWTVTHGNRMALYGALRYVTNRTHRSGL
jgi:hypothetical protein